MYIAVKPPSGCGKLVSWQRPPSTLRTTKLHTNLKTTQPSKTTKHRTTRHTNHSSAATTKILTKTTHSMFSTLSSSTAQTHPCVCNDNHVELFIYKCPVKGSNVSGVLHQRDNFRTFSPDFCKSKAIKYRTVHGWETVVHNGQVSGLHMLFFLQLKHCCNY